MSADTNLHRTFDYQLSPAPLRIIDWAPVKSVAASVLQSGPNVKSYGVVDRTSPNEAAVAAAYARQENAKREASKTRGGAGDVEAPSSFTEHDVVDLPSPSTQVTTSPYVLAGGSGTSNEALTPIVAGQMDSTVAIAAASPYYTPGASVNTCGELGDMHVLDGCAPQRPYSDNWTGSSNETAATPPAGGLPFPPSVTSTPATAAAAAAAGTPAMDCATATAPAGNRSGNNSSGGGVHGTAIPTANGNAAGRSETTMPKTNAPPPLAAPPSAAVADVAPRTRATLPSSLSPSSTPALARYRNQWGGAGTMYGFDSVYQNGSFGILLGLFTGVGYQQTNVVYRQEEVVLDATRGTSALLPSAGVSAGGTTSGGAGGGATPGLTTSSLNHLSPSEGIAAASAAAPVTDGRVGFGNSEGVSGAVNVNGGPGTAAADEHHAQRTRVSPVLAYKKKGGFELSNVIQCFWYWGAKRWTGVFNLRFTPLLSGDAVVPVCECVVRTDITENSILIDDPVVYIHSFVVMLGRRKRTPDDMLNLIDDAADDRSTSPRHLSAKPDIVHSLATNAAKGTSDEAPLEHPSAAPKASEKKVALTTTDSKRPSPSSPESSKAKQSTERATATTSTARVPTDATNTRIPLSPRQETAAQSSTPVKSCASTSPSGVDTRARAATSATDLSKSHQHISNKGGSDAAEGLKERPWHHWYQRCIMDTSDEWLWNRTAAEVAAEAAQSTTPWWRLRHVKTGVGLSYRYRKSRGINVYWGGSAQLGRGTSLSGHVDVLRRMSCSVSSSFGFLDLSVRLRVNLVTLHQTALDAGLCWRPLPHVPELAVRLATSANGTTLGIEVDDVALRLYAPLVERLSRYRAEKARARIDGKGDGDVVAGDALPSQTSASGVLSTPSTPAEPKDGSESNREDLVGLLPVTWHYLRGFGSTITHTYSSVAWAIASSWKARSAESEGHAANATAAATMVKGTVDGHRVPAAGPPLPVVAPSFTAVPPKTSLANRFSLSRVVPPGGRASVRYVRDTCRYIADLGWLETMLRTSHVNVSMGITSEPGKLTRDWSVFLILSEK
jgi:hypothetical protein